MDRETPTQEPQLGEAVKALRVAALLYIIYRVILNGAQRVGIIDPPVEQR